MLVSDRCHYRCCPPNFKALYYFFPICSLSPSEILPQFIPKILWEEYKSLLDCRRNQLMSADGNRWCQLWRGARGWGRSGTVGIHWREIRCRVQNSSRENHLVFRIWSLRNNDARYMHILTYSNKKKKKKKTLEWTWRKYASVIPNTISLNSSVANWWQSSNFQPTQLFPSLFVSWFILSLKLSRTIKRTFPFNLQCVSCFCDLLMYFSRFE